MGQGVEVEVSVMGTEVDVVFVVEVRDWLRRVSFIVDGWMESGFVRCSLFVGGIAKNGEGVGD